MPPPTVYRLPVIPSLPAFPLDSPPPVEEIDKIYDGFLPVGTATLIPCPWDDHFGWTTENKRIVVNVIKDTERDTFKETVKAKDLSFKVVLYVGIPNTSPPGQPSAQRFVYIGNQRGIKESAKRTYIRYQDLARRIEKGCRGIYTEDLQTYSKNKAQPFVAWDERWSSVSTIKPDKWRSFYGELLEPPYKMLEKDQYDRLFSKYCGFASAATYTQKEPYSTVSRFFNSSVTTNIKLFFRLREKPANSHEIVQFEKFVKEAMGKSEFKATYSVLAYRNDTTWLEDMSQIGGHPLDLYTIWVLRAQYEDKGHAPGLWGSMYKFKYQFQKTITDQGVWLKPTNNKEKDVFAPLGSPEKSKTRTVVTALRVNAARGRQRVPDQIAVMNGASPNLAAKNLWVNQEGNVFEGNAEWLHRSAFSYGGLGERRSINSSQDVNNLILGTKATNTAMMRVEEFIKRWVVRTGEKAIVETEVLHTTGDIKPGWMSDVLLYKFRLYQPNPATSEFLEKSIKFSMLKNDTPLRLDFELGRLFEAHIFGWTTSMEEDQYETKVESEDKKNEMEEEKMEEKVDEKIKDGKMEEEG